MKVEKAVITAAGLGTRFLPATKAIPKPMLPVFDKPTIQYIMEEIRDAGIKKVAIIVSPDTQIIEEHFSEAKVLEENLLANGKKDLYDIAMQTRDFGEIEFIVQQRPDGLANAVYCAKDFVGNEPFALLMGDEIYDKKDGKRSCLKKLIDEYYETGFSQVNTIEVFGDDVSKYGNLAVVDGVGGRLKVVDIIEKPTLDQAFSNFGSIGRYVLSPKLFDYIDATRPKTYAGEIYLTDSLKMLAENDGLCACPFDDDRYDIGDKAGYVKANLVYALKNEKIKAEIADWIKELSEKL
ncbi:MAG: UTP--glucose-1-phosphate uridylyltransferase [Clostridia bacterium]|nr:UTP--glucose-1-phosphate uridylyltransferase [Clostridia bacterium]